MKMMQDFSELIENSEKRQNCPNCERPQRVCWCEFLPKPKVKLSKTQIIILQHPNEKKRPIRTAKILELGLENCVTFVRRKVTSLEIKDNLSEEEKSLRAWLSHPKAFVLFPKGVIHKPCGRRG